MQGRCARRGRPPGAVGELQLGEYPAASASRESPAGRCASIGTRQATEGEHFVLDRMRSHLTYANAMATTAVFIALGGFAFAAVELPKHSVGSAQLKKHSVTPRKLAPSTIALFKGQKGDTGPAGQNGTNGLDGAARAYGRVSGTTVTRSKNVVSVSSPGTGTFCITLDPSIDASTVEAVVTPDFSGGNTNVVANGSQANVETFPGGTGSCTLGQIGVVTYERTVNYDVLNNKVTGVVLTAVNNIPFFFVVP
jgi:hypothetical protein